MLHSLFGWSVDYLSEQTVSLIQSNEFEVRYHRFLLVGVCSRVVLCCAILIKQVRVSVLPELVLSSFDDCRSSPQLIHLVEFGFLLFIHLSVLLSATKNSL